MEKLHLARVTLLQLSNIGPLSGWSPSPKQYILTENLLKEGRPWPPKQYILTENLLKEGRAHPNNIYFFV
jgi:hypothetical protein